MKPIKHPVLLSLIPLLFLFLCFLGGYAFLDHLFPKAAPLSVPAEEAITAITLTDDSGTVIPISPADNAALLHALHFVRPTRKMSVNDTPSARPYVLLEVTTAARYYRYYIYEESAQVCVELPYEGVYHASPQLLDLIRN